MTQLAIDPKASRLSWARRTKRQWAYLLAPAILLLLVIFVLPMFNLALKSLHPFAGPGAVGSAITFKNYATFLGQPFYWQLIGWTALLGLIVVCCSLAIALPLAYFLVRTTSRWKPILLLIVVAPMLVSVVIRNLGWFPILGERGVINWFWRYVVPGAPPLHLLDNYLGVVVGLVHAVLPFMVLTLVTVMQRIAPELEEASINLGFTPVQTFIRVVLPLALPGVIAGSLVVFTLTISAYTTPAIMGGGHVIVVSTYIQQQVSTLLNYANGATVAMVLLVLVIALSIMSLRLGKTGA